MSDSCPTARIVDAAQEQGFRIINKSDFVDGEHELFYEADSTPPPPPPPPEPPVYADMTVVELKALLTERGVMFASNTTKAELIALASQ